MNAASIDDLTPEEYQWILDQLFVLDSDGHYGICSEPKNVPESPGCFFCTLMVKLQGKAYDL